MRWSLSSSLSGGDSHDLDDDELQHEHKENNGGKPVPIRTTFELADTLYAEAELEETDTVYLFLARSTPFQSLFVSVLNKSSTYAGKRYVVLQNSGHPNTRKCVYLSAYMSLAPPPPP
jgi:hypothetical protein